MQSFRSPITPQTPDPQPVQLNSDVLAFDSTHFIESQKQFTHLSQTKWGRSSVKSNLNPTEDSLGNCTDTTTNGDR